MKAFKCPNFECFEKCLQSCSNCANYIWGQTSTRNAPLIKPKLEHQHEDKNAMKTEYMVVWVDKNGRFHQCTVVTYGPPFPHDISPDCDSINSAQPTGRTFR